MGGRREEERGEREERGGGEGRVEGRGEGEGRGEWEGGERERRTHSHIHLSKTQVSQGNLGHSPPEISLDCY